MTKILRSSVSAMAIGSLAMDKASYARMMADVYKSPLLTYPAIVTGGATFAQLQTAVNTTIGILKAALTPSATAPASMPHTDFDHIPPAIAAKLVAELTAIQAVVTAAT